MVWTSEIYETSEVLWHKKIPAAGKEWVVSWMACRRVEGGLGSVQSECDEVAMSAATNGVKFEKLRVGCR